MFNEEEEDDQVITQKLTGLLQQNELQYKQYCYDQAMTNMIQNPTLERIKEFEKAEKDLYSTQDLYHDGSLLLLEHKIQTDHDHISRGLHGV